MIELDPLHIFAILMYTITGLFIIAGIKDPYCRAEFFGVSVFCGVVSIILHVVGSGWVVITG